MTAYANDSRVQASGDGYVVAGDPYDRKVIDSPVLDWCVYEGPDMAMLACGHATADDAIASLIGPPKES